MRTQASRRRRALAAIAAALVLLGLAAPQAPASELLTWTTSSDFVDPNRVKFNNPPPDTPPRPPALRVNILLPDGFTRKRRWPVLYLLHGHGDAYDYWANPKRGNVLDVARGFPGIIVMPEAATGWYANWWNGGRRRDPAWERYHLDELIPLVKKRLPIRRKRRWHAIAGLSMGGEGAMFYASLRPGYFGSAASFSGPLSIQRLEYVGGFESQGERYADVYGSSDGFYAAGHNPTALAANLRHTRLYVTVGNGVADPSKPNEVTNHFGQLAELDLSQHAVDFVNAARAAGADVTYRPRQGIHDWPYWRQHLADALAWGFFAPVPNQPRSWSYETVAQTGNMWGIGFRFSAPPETLERLSLDGRVMKLSGSGLVLLRTPSGCRLQLPGDATRMLPRGFRRKPRTRVARRRAKRACGRARQGGVLTS
jgi:S-formylglutathione hydrolase FrmB